MLARLRINGRPVPTVCNQMVFDLTEFDSFPEINLPEDPLAQPIPLPAPQKCVCGAKAVGINDFMPGHSSWCEVFHEKTPIIAPRFP